MKLSKWTYEIIGVGILLSILLSAWWVLDTRDARAANAKYEQLIRIANLQQVEIAVIEQASTLQQYKNQIRKAQASQFNMPAIADPKDIGIENGK